MFCTLAGSLVVSAILYSQYTEFHLEYADYDLRTYNTLAIYQQTSDPVQDIVNKLNAEVLFKNSVEAIYSRLDPKFSSKVAPAIIWRILREE
jgi:hypothetical protein